jgi:uncharacterized membrane protein YfcA
MSSRRRWPRPKDPATPPLLPILVAGTVGMVAAVAVVGRTDNEWADVAAVALLLVTLAVGRRAILRLLQDDEAAPDEKRGRRPNDRTIGGS